MGDFLQRLTLWPTPNLKPPKYKLVKMNRLERRSTMRKARQAILDEYATLVHGRQPYVARHRGLFLFKKMKQIEYHCIKDLLSRRNLRKKKTG
jgi:hypothetical protein